MKDETILRHYTILLFIKSTTGTNFSKHSIAPTFEFLLIQMAAAGHSSLFIFFAGIYGLIVSGVKQPYFLSLMSLRWGLEAGTLLGWTLRQFFGSQRKNRICTHSTVAPWLLGICVCLKTCVGLYYCWLFIQSYLPCCCLDHWFRSTIFIEMLGNCDYKE